MGSVLEVRDPSVLVVLPVWNTVAPICFNEGQTLMIRIQMDSIAIMMVQRILVT